ncbi:MAG: beta-propeller fold lactonase family protein [Spirochaetes bacterium]|nr:beta-propeller fold lactonase family protein [Spirochaetota bacterium]
MKQITIFIETYTEPSYREKGKGIYSYKLDLESGSLVLLQNFTDVANPSYIATDPARNRLYCVNELQKFETKPSGAVTAFSVDRDTAFLNKLNTLSSEGMDPCHIIVGELGGTCLSRIIRAGA